MEESAPAAPPGWYPGPDGKLRYWDGRAWLQIPPPENPRIDTLPAEAAARDESASNRRWIWVAVVVLALTGIGVGINTASNARAARETAAVAAQEAEQKEARAARSKVAAEQAAQAEEVRERQQRQEAVTDIEKSIKTMAKKHVKTGLIDGPVLDVSCNPVAGGSVDDLSEETTVFQCFVSTKKNNDGTSSGYYYNATKNWTSGEYTYGYGEP